MDERSPNIHTTHELVTSDATPFLPVVENTDKDRHTTFGISIGKLYTDFQSNFYLCGAAFLSITGGILFGYDLGIISGAILQLKTEFCLGISKSEVRYQYYFKATFFSEKLKYNLFCGIQVSTVFHFLPKLKCC